MYSRTSNNLLFRLAALALVLWLSGAVCLLSCERRVQAGGRAEVTSAAEAPAHAHHAAPQSSSGHACCHRAKTGGSERKPESLDNLARLVPQVTFCCNFAGQMASAALRPARAQDSAPSLTLAPEPRFYGPDVPLPARPLNRPPPLDRSETQLRDCVFLI
jgi:hypothetical protein